jgi:hypothetical protein
VKAIKIIANVMKAIFSVLNDSPPGGYLNGVFAVLQSITGGMARYSADASIDSEFDTGYDSSDGKSPHRPGFWRF